MPGTLASCHSAMVDGYLIEGHVPAKDIARLLKERPKGIKGLAVAGMPLGSPGMEVAGMKARHVDVGAVGLPDRVPPDGAEPRYTLRQLGPVDPAELCA